MQHIKIIKTVCSALFIISLFCTVDLGLNFFYNLAPELHDGYTTCSILHGVFGIFGDHSWSFEMFFNAFKTSVWISFIILVLNIVLYFCKEAEK